MNNIIFFQLGLNKFFVKFQEFSRRLTCVCLKQHNSIGDYIKCRMACLYGKGLRCILCNRAVLEMTVENLNLHYKTYHRSIERTDPDRWDIIMGRRTAYVLVKKL